MRKFFHNLLKGLSVTSALFVVTACYGPPPGYYEEPVPEPEGQTVIQTAEPQEDEAPVLEADIEEGENA